MHNLKIISLLVIFVSTCTTSRTIKPAIISKTIHKQTIEHHETKCQPSVEPLRNDIDTKSVIIGSASTVAIMLGYKIGLFSVFRWVIGLFRRKKREVIRIVVNDKAKSS